MLAPKRREAPPDMKVRLVTQYDDRVPDFFENHRCNTDNIKKAREPEIDYWHYTNPVLIDAPPVGVVIDAAEIASGCDAAVLVLQYNKTRLREVAECKRQLEQSGTPVLGCIINRVTFNGISEKRYYSRSYYRRYNREYER